LFFFDDRFTFAVMSEIGTIGDAFNQGWQLSAACRHGLVDTGSSSRKCDWKYNLDMTTLVATRGRDFPIDRVSERLRCPVAAAARSQFFS
jgi:hypothetical protein